MFICKTISGVLTISVIQHPKRSYSMLFDLCHLGLYFWKSINLFLFMFCFYKPCYLVKMSKCTSSKYHRYIVFALLHKAVNKWFPNLVQYGHNWSFYLCLTFSISVVCWFNTVSCSFAACLPQIIFIYSYFATANRFHGNATLRKLYLLFKCFSLNNSTQLNFIYKAL